MLAKVAIIESTENWRTALSCAAEVHVQLVLAKINCNNIESTESTENWRTAQSGIHTQCCDNLCNIYRELKNSPFMHVHAAEVYTVLAMVAIIEYTESTENWRTALSGIHTQCCDNLCNIEGQRTVYSILQRLSQHCCSPVLCGLCELPLQAMCTSSQLHIKGLFSSSLWTLWTLLLLALCTSAAPA